MVRILASPRVLRTGQPLGLEAIRQVCPAVFAEYKSENTSARYQYIPTIVPLKALLDGGWGVYEASQERARKYEKDLYKKHMIRMRRLEHFSGAPTDLGGVPEVVMITAHDGTASYRLTGGFFRYICSNGMIVGTSVASYVVRHTVGPQTTEEVLRAGERIVTDSFPRMISQIERFRGIHVREDHRVRLAQKAKELRGSDLQITDLLTVRRDEDKEPTLWNLLNIVQENTVYGGFSNRTRFSSRNTLVRGIESVSAVTRVNAGIWDEAEAIAKEFA